MLTITRTTAAMLLAGLPCGLALADHPEVWSLVPADAPLVVSIANVESFFTGLQAAAELTGSPEAKMGVGEAAGMLEMPGVNRAGSAAIVFSTLENLDQTDSPPMVLLVPVSSYTDLAGALGGTGEGLEQLQFQGSDVFARQIADGYAALAPTRELIEGFGAGDAASHTAAMGAIGERLATDHGVLVSVTVDAFAENLLKGWEEGQQQMRQFSQFGGGNAEQVESQIKMLDTVVRTFVRDGNRAMIGVTTDARGISLDFAASFDEGSELAGYFTGASNAGSLLTRLPGGPYLMAWAMDTSSEGIATLMKNAAELTAGQQMPGMDMMQMVRGARGFASVVGMNPAGLMAGLLTNTSIVMEVPDANAAIAGYGESIAGMNNQIINGMNITSSFAQQPEQVAGGSAHRWSIRMLPDMNQPGAQQMQMAMPFIFGPGGGPGGYIAAADKDSVVLTYSTSQQHLTSAVTAARDGGTLADAALFAEQARRQHADAFMVSYVDAGTIARQIVPFAAMMGAQLNVEIPDEVSPIAMSAASSSGGMTFRTVIPADVITMFAGFAEAAQAMQGGGFEGQEEEPQF
jgi:hypothetical protein